MKTFNFLIIALLIMGLTATPVLADGDAGHESVFLLGVDARALGMGGSYVAVTSGASSVYWNPAGLGLLDKAEVSLLHITLWENTYYDFVGVAYPTLSYGSFGLGAIRLGTSDIIRRDPFNQPGPAFDNSFSEYIFSYGVNFPLLINGGLNFKILNHSLDDRSATGFGLDLGILATPTPFLSWGLNWQDILEPELKLQTTEEKIPSNLKAGIKLSHQFSNQSILAAFDIDKTRGRDVKFHAGGEYGLFETLFLRGGFDKDYATFGVGILYNFLQADYAFKFQNDLGNTHRISLTFRFGRSVSKRKEVQLEADLQRRMQAIETEKKAKAKQFLKEGENFESKQDWLSAYVSYQKTLAWEPENSTALAKADFLRPKIYQTQKEKTEKEINSLLVENYLKVTQEYQDKQDFKPALLLIGQALKLEPQNQKVLSLQRELLKAQNDKILELERKGSESYNKGNYPEAILAWNQILEMDSTHLAAKSNIDLASSKVKTASYLKQGIEFFNSGNFSLAEKQFNLALSVDPKNRVALDYLQQVRARTAKRTTLEDLKKDLEIWKIYQEALSKYQQGKYQEALDLWNEVLKVYPNNQNTLRNIQQAKARLQKSQ